MQLNSLIPMEFLTNMRRVSICLLFSLITDIPRSVWRLLCNPVYMVLVIGGCCEICIVSGFCVFLPKYLETQFGISKSAANLLTGIALCCFQLAMEIP